MSRLSVLGALLCAAWARADSPLTSIDFADAYRDVPTVASLRGGAAPDVAWPFLLGDAPNDQKLAVMTALGTDQGLGAGFVSVLAQRLGVSAQKLTVADLTASQRFVVGFLLALDDTGRLAPLGTKGGGLWTATPQALLASAARALPDDFAVQYAQALVSAQVALFSDWCRVFRLPQAVEQRFPPAKRNLRPGALERVQGYLAGYEESCPGSAAAARKAKEALNESYAVALLGTQVVNGTQGGVVVWEAGRPQPVLVEPGFICKVLRHGEAVFAGCEKDVLRWDGKALRRLPVPAGRLAPAEYFEPVPGPGGALWVRRGGRLFRFDPAADAFTEAAPPWRPGTLVSDVLGAPSGDVHWVTFMESVHARDRTWPKGSAGYAGLDPRALARTADGTLWALDFASGFFRFLPESQAWVKQPGVADKASAVAVDSARGRTWLLHYTDGLVLQERGQPDVRLSFAGLQYLRALALAPDGSVWVGAIGGLVHVWWDGKQWAQDRLLVR